MTDSIQLGVDIGKKLQQRRHSRRLNLAAVSQKAGVSLGLLSQIERGVTTPSLRSLQRICDALEMPVSWLFDGVVENSDIIVRAGARRRMDLGPGSMVKELLTPDEVLDIQMIRIVIQPGGRSSDRAYNNPIGAKSGIVVSGRLGLEVGGQVHMVGPGDSFAFQATEMHNFWCEGEAPVDLYWVVSPALY